MVQVWSNYLTDTNYNYPFVPINIKRIGDISREDSPLLILPNNDFLTSADIKTPCNVPQLTYRKIRFFFSDESVYEINYYRPFSANLFDYLSASISVRAFEFIGESIKYSRLIKMLNRE